jgi:hypothetical protein
LLAHYIEKHQYLPPQEFLDAVEEMEVEKKNFSRSVNRKVKFIPKYGDEFGEYSEQ